MQKRKPSSSRWNRRALTLIECLVGLVILGTVLSCVLIFRARYVHQAAIARRRAVAVRAADALLLRWWGRSIPDVREQDGKVDGNEDLSWRTRLVPSDAAAGLGVRVLRLEIVDDRATAADSVLARVDLVVPPAPPASRPVDGSEKDGN